MEAISPPSWKVYALFGAMVFVVLQQLKWVFDYTYHQGMQLRKRLQFANQVANQQQQQQQQEKHAPRHTGSGGGNGWVRRSPP